MRAIEEEPPAPFADHLFHLTDRQREQGHGKPERHELRAHQRRQAAEGIEIDGQLVGIEGNVDDLEPAGAGRADRPVGAVPAERLGHAHDDVARLRQRRIGHRIADHAGAHAVVGITAAEVLLQKLDRQRLHLVDMPRAGEPAVDRADMTLGGAGADLGCQQGSHPRARRCLRRQEIDALLAPPPPVALHRRDHLAAHRFRIERVDQAAGVRQRRPVMHLDCVVVESRPCSLHPRLSARPGARCPRSSQASPIARLRPARCLPRWRRSRTAG